MSEENFLNTINVNPISFKAAYKIKGSKDALDEICWFLQRKKKISSPEFDFMDIRLIKNSLSETDKFLGNANIGDVKSPTAIDATTEHLLDLIAIRQGQKEPFLPPVTKYNVDLFLTGEEKKLAEREAVNMVEDSLLPAFKRMNPIDTVRVLLDNLSSMRKSLSNGNPILNLKQPVVQEHLPFLKLFDIPILNADEVLPNIEKNQFDIFKGLIIA